ncbi:P-loop NTPase fold protein [Pseudomonas sp. L7]|uniref:P-loop NTPase fold protein n=1 Tax=Pseudomonas TaxID=286 RepID=UPI0039849EBD
MQALEKHLDNLVHRQLDVAVLKGDWGVGKTHFFNTYVAKLDSTPGAAGTLNAYCYISLFGVNSIEQVKTKLHQSTRFYTQPHAQPGDFREQFVHKTHALVKRSKQRLLNYNDQLKNAPILNRAAKAIDSASNAAISNYLICIDDLERKGKDLKIKEIMGFIDELRTQRKCAILIILNEDTLEDADIREYNNYREKVIDAEFLYDPSPAENFGKVFDEADFGFADAQALSCALEIKNIRILEKVWQTLENHRDLIERSRESVIREFVHCAVLMTWAYFSAGAEEEEAALKKRLLHAPLSDALKLKEGETYTRHHKLLNFAKNKLLIMDSKFHNPLARYLIQGYPDTDALEALLCDEEKNTRARDAERLWRETWEHYTNSLSDNYEQIRNNLVILLDSEYFTAYNLSHFMRAIEFLEDMGETVEPWVQGFIERHEELIARGDFDAWKNTKNATLAAAIQAPRLKEAIPLELTDTLKMLAISGYWSAAQLQFLASHTADDFYNWMKSDPKDPLTLINKGLLGLKAMGADEEDAHKVSQILERTNAALDRLTADSEINKKRIPELYPR